MQVQLLRRLIQCLHIVVIGEKRVRNVPPSTVISSLLMIWSWLLPAAAQTAAKSATEIAVNEAALLVQDHGEAENIEEAGKPNPHQKVGIFLMPKTATTAREGASLGSCLNSKWLPFDALVSKGLLCTKRLPFLWNFWSLDL